MAEELYLNNFKIELPDKVVTQTLQINDVGDVVDRQANYSNNIKIPRTPNNVRAFEMLGISGNTTRYPYASISVKYIVDGIELISNGKGVVKNTNEFYNLVIYDGVISLSDLLGNLTLEELDYSAYDHNLTEASWVSSFSKTDGYIYALGKFITEASTSFINIDLQNVSFYLHTLFEIIFSQKGYSITGDFFTDADYLKRLISMNIGYDRTATQILTQVYQRDNSTDSPVLEVFPPGPHQQYIHLMDSYTATSTNIHNIIMNGTYDILTGLAENVLVYVNGVLEVTLSLETPLAKDFNISVASGDLIEIKLKFLSQDDGANETVSFETDYITTINENALTIPIVIGDLIGDTRQIDFVKEVMQRYGLIIRKVRNENTYDFIRMDELLIDKDLAEDWSGKYSTFSNEVYLPNYAQRNLFKFTYDSDQSEEAQTFADGEMLVDNVNLNPEKTIITSIFKASNLKSDDLYELNHWVRDDLVIVENLDGLRIFERKDVSTTIQYRFNNSVQGVSSFTGTIPYLDFTPVTYQNELDNNYVEFNLMLNDYKKINLMINLNLIDIYSINFFKLKYFNQLGKYYYLNKVSNFKKNKLTMCEFVQVGIS